MPQLHHHAPPVEIASLVQPVEIFVMPDKIKNAAEAGNHIAGLATKPLPTDIVVMGTRAGHYTGGVVLEAHGHAHAADDPTIVRLSVKKQNMIMWYCRSHKFSVYNIAPDFDAAPDEFKKYDGPPNPFYRDLPFGRDEEFVISGPLKNDAHGGFFKVMLRIGSKLIDPHIASEP